MARNKKKEEKIWAYKVKHPEASNSEIAKATKTSYGYVWKLMKKVGTPKEVLERGYLMNSQPVDQAAGATDIEPDWVGVSRETTPEEAPVLPPLYNRSGILEEASSLISGERHEEYGDAKGNFEKIAGYWNAHLGLVNFISAQDVAAMMVLLKVSRLQGEEPQIDTYIDICGYAAIGGEIASSD
tara:strand:+ start:2712 stop:3263 length:552 start_codon:yes stop_codon:yes gene_type:complete